MNAATIFAALRAFFSLWSMDIAVYAPTSKFFLPTLSQAALMIGIAIAKSLGLDALMSAPSPTSSGEVEDLGALGTDVDRNTLLSGEGDTRQLCAVVVEELHAGLVHLFTGTGSGGFAHSFS